VQIHLTARHCELGPEVRRFAEQRLEKIQRYDDGIHEVRVIVSAERKIHTAEITLRAHREDLVITESHTDVLAALELAADRLEDRVRRNKDRRVSAPRREARNGGPAPAPAPDTGDEGDED
jgi:putative sigma-54 modulation protein